MHPFSWAKGGRVVVLCAAALACERTATDPVQPPNSTVDLSSTNSTSAGTAGAPSQTLLANLGTLVFHDGSLSLGQNQSCASCHDAAWGFTLPQSAVNAAGAVPTGSVAGRFGSRKPPSTAYATQSPVLQFNSLLGSFVGGTFWDGRATGQRLGSPTAEQAEAPFINPVEQALPDKACVVFRVTHGTSSTAFVAAWGSSIFSVHFPTNTDALCRQAGVTIPLSATDQTAVAAAYDQIALSIAAFEGSPAVNQFSSKFDASLTNRATLTAQEQQGLALFSGKAKCTGCHPNAGPNALFTNYTYDNIGVPPNPKNPLLLANPQFRDLGLGGFLGDPTQNGKEKVPTLRNVDKRVITTGVKAYMHNGVFKSLDQVVHFLNTRNVLPTCQSISNPSFGVNCWPAPEVAQNVNQTQVGNLGLSAAEEAALVAYLKTLSDGFVPVSSNSK